MPFPSCRDAAQERADHEHLDDHVPDERLDSRADRRGQRGRWGWRTAQPNQQPLRPNQGLAPRLIDGGGQPPVAVQRCEQQPGK